MIQRTSTVLMNMATELKMTQLKLVQNVHRRQVIQSALPLAAPNMDMVVAQLPPLILELSAKVSTTILKTSMVQMNMDTEVKLVQLTTTSVHQLDALNMVTVVAQQQPQTSTSSV